MPIISAGILGGAGLAGGLIGDIFSSNSAAATNQMNMQIAQMNNQFNAQQAQLNRQFQEGMSDTAMTRRVADLKNAGLNPLLAMGSLGGAQAMPGATAQSAGLPQMQNPGASFAQLGNQMAGAASSGLQAYQASSQVALMQSQAKAADAQAAKAESDARYTAGALTDSTRAQTAQTQQYVQLIGPAEAAYKQALSTLPPQQISLMQQQGQEISARIANINANTSLQDMQRIFTSVQTQVSTLDAVRQAAVMKPLVEQIWATSQMIVNSTVASQNQKDFAQSWLGKLAPYIQTALPVINTAISAAKPFGGFGPIGGQAVGGQPAGNPMGGLFQLGQMP